MTFHYTENMPSERFDSSFIHAVYYNDETSEMAVEFANGTVTVYEHVSKWLYNDFIDNYSLGSFWNDEFKSWSKGRYHEDGFFEKVEVPLAAIVDKEEDSKTVKWPARPTTDSSIAVTYFSNGTLSTPEPVEFEYKVFYHLSNEFGMRDATVRATNDTEALENFKTAAAVLNLNVAPVSVSRSV